MLVLLGRFFLILFPIVELFKIKARKVVLLGQLENVPVQINLLQYLWTLSLFGKINMTKLYVFPVDVQGVRYLFEFDLSS